MRIGWGEVIIILAVALLLFGAKRLPDVARAIGRSVKELKRGMNEPVEEERPEDKKE